MSDDVMQVFRRRMMSVELQAVRSESDILRLSPDPTSGSPPRVLLGIFRELQYMEPRPDGAVHAVQRPLPFSLQLPDDYCNCTDGSLQMRVARILTPIAHPNVGPGGIVCLGPRFRPATRLAPLLEHLHRICSSNLFAAESPLNPYAAELYRRHAEAIKGLHSAPLWKRPVVDRVRIVSAEGERRGER
ncbi:MAG: hypothetical protein JRH01_17145 [Deltaproteobacteria bacterium]|nr:hypothetical protein [Deltaproteobacteria bacterium]